MVNKAPDIADDHTQAKTITNLSSKSGNTTTQRRMTHLILKQSRQTLNKNNC